MPSKFSIPETGATRTLSFKANPDYESPGDSGGDNVYEVTLVVTDSKGNTDEQDVTVKVTNIEEDGVVTLSTLQPRVGFPVTATLADPDNVTEGSVSWQWYDGTISSATLNLTDSKCHMRTPRLPQLSYTPYLGMTRWVTLSQNADGGRASYTDGNANEADAPRTLPHRRSGEQLVLRTRATRRRYSRTRTLRWTAARRPRSGLIGENTESGNETRTVGET